MIDVGTNLSLEKCLDLCQEKGQTVCNNVEYGRSNIQFNCRLWSGTCETHQFGEFNSDIYIRSNLSCPTDATLCFQASDGTTYAQYNGLDVNNDKDIKTLTKMTRLGCADSCQATKECRSADFNPSSKQCFLTSVGWSSSLNTRPLKQINSIWRLPAFSFDHKTVEVYTGHFQNGMYNGLGILEKNGER